MFHKPKTLFRNVSEHVICLFLRFVINRSNRLILMTLPGGSGKETAHKNNRKNNKQPTKLLSFSSSSLYLWASNNNLCEQSVDAHFNCCLSEIKSHKSVVPQLLHQSCGC